MLRDLEEIRIDRAQRSVPSLHAARGLEGETVAMPHANLLESALGRSLGHISVHAGPRATEAADALGARAYSYRGEIVLGASAGMQTVAEEAVHALQYSGGGRAGAGGVTSLSDPAELEACSLAESIVAGQSVAAPSQGLGSDVIARDAKDKPKTDKGATAQVTLARPAQFAPTTLQILRQKYPEAHAPDGTLLPNKARRHIVPSSALLDQVLRGVNGQPLPAAAAYLASNGHPVAPPLSNEAIQRAAQAFYERLYNMPDNLWVGDSKENSAIKDHYLDLPPSLSKEDEKSIKGFAKNIGYEEKYSE